MTIKVDITTSRLRLSRFGVQELTERYVSWLNDPDVVRYSEQRHRKHTLESCREYLASYDGTPNLFLAIRTRPPENRHIGNINAYIDTCNDVADLGILIGEKDVWGKGYGAEAWAGLSRHLFESAGIRKITAGTMAANRAMIRLLEKVGMIEECRRTNQFLLDGKTVDAVYFAYFKS